MYRSKVAIEATGFQYRIQNFLNFYHFLKTAFSGIFQAQNLEHKINMNQLLILNFINLYFYFYFGFKKGLLLLFQSFDLKNQEGKDYIFQEQMASNQKFSRSCCLGTWLKHIITNGSLIFG